MEIFLIRMREVWRYVGRQCYIESSEEGFARYGFSVTLFLSPTEVVVVMKKGGFEMCVGFD